MDLLLWGFVALLMAADLFADRGLGASALHVTLQCATLAIALTCALTTLRRLVAARKRASALDATLDESRRESERWRAEAEHLVAGLGGAMDRQFDRWAFTHAEREVALMLLKGRTHREIAQARGTGEQTVRQQSLAVYRKAGIAGRAELSAFFLSDLLLPQRAN